ncbi:MAG TPA: PhzF family phenazine biosynthesis protein [Methanoregula sp.]|nr:PhzF family phenazine biosynthesis protein [Methanoregula sp.]
MQRLRFKKIDAFVCARSSGNPAGCIYLDSTEMLSPEQMQQVAREMAGCVSEVVFVSREDDNITLRFFSAECEVAFCGHGTIAAMHDLIKNDPDLLRKPIVSIQIGDQQILIRNDIAEEDAVFVSAPLPLTLTTIPDSDAVAAALKLPPGEITDPAKISVVSAGLVTLIVPLRSLATLLATRPDSQHLKEFCIRHGIEIVLIHTDEVATEGAAYRTRVFAPVFGYLEDPATGSGNAAFGYHLLANRSWDGKTIRIEQGRSRENPNIIRLASDSSERQRTVYFGGNGIVRIEGEYLLQ